MMGNLAINYVIWAILTLIINNASFIAIYASTTSVLLQKSCSVLSRKGIKNISISRSLVALRNSICGNDGGLPCLFTTLL